ncbi:MAG: Leucine aminopeptidase 1 [Trichoglossum hirsutum]|nr:MAG: Leucine aminopeptidase 1 [Trichoglossum hirsutum]
MASDYAKERCIAELAIQRASLLTQTVLLALDKGSLNKDDNSPVTIADLGSQALIISAIHHNFPGDIFIGEEDAKALRSDEQLQQRVWELVSSTHLDDKESEDVLGTVNSCAEMLDAIDLGSSTRSQKGRVWVLDPIDGTKDFMRGAQYAVCLALLEEGIQEVGVLGCPNLNADATNIFDGPPKTPGPGIIISAVSGHGATTRPMSAGSLLPSRPLPLLPSPPLTSQLRFIDHQKSFDYSNPTYALIAHYLKTPYPALNLRSQQLRWAALALGRGDIMVRIPQYREERDCIWDIAGGVLIANELGARVTDAWGESLDFGAGRRLEGNFGLVGAHEGVHGEVLRAVERSGLGWNQSSEQVKL